MTSFGFSASTLAGSLPSSATIFIFFPFLLAWLGPPRFLLNADMFLVSSANLASKDVPLHVHVHATLESAPSGQNDVLKNNINNGLDLYSAFLGTQNHFL